MSRGVTARNKERDIIVDKLGSAEGIRSVGISLLGEDLKNALPRLFDGEQAAAIASTHSRHGTSSHAAELGDGSVHAPRAGAKGHFGPERKQAAFHELGQDLLEQGEDTAARALLQRVQVDAKGGFSYEVKCEENIELRQVEDFSRSCRSAQCVSVRLGDKND